MRVIIAGGSGTLGQALAADLAQRGHEIYVLTRSRNPDLPFTQVTWDEDWASLLNEETGIVNLAGRLVDARPTRANVDDLRRSRVEPTRTLVRASRQRPVAAWVQASTTAIWSDAGDARVTETSPLPRGADALPQMTGVARAWEDALEGARAANLTVLRTSIVIAPHTTAFDRLAFLARFGAGGTVAGGRQWFSWISERDWLAIVRCALGLEAPALPGGVVIAAAPQPVRNEELMRILRERYAPRVLGRRLGIPTPGPLLRLGALALRTDPALALTGRHATSEVLERCGFVFRDPRLEELVDSFTFR